MLNELDKKIKLDILITIIATFISINFLIFSYIFKDYTSEILSILVILLSTIYIIGNQIIRGIINNEINSLRDEYYEVILEINEGVEEMKEELDFLRANSK